MIDERFLMHRYKATSHAAVVAAVTLGFFLLRGQLRGQGLNRELLTVMVAMAVTKIACLIYFRIKD